MSAPAAEIPLKVVLEGLKPDIIEYFRKDGYDDIEFIQTITELIICLLSQETERDLQAELQQYFDGCDIPKFLAWIREEIRKVQKTSLEKDTSAPQTNDQPQPDGSVTIVEEDDAETKRKKRAARFGSVIPVAEATENKKDQRAKRFKTQDQPTEQPKEQPKKNQKNKKQPQNEKKKKAPEPKSEVPTKKRKLDQPEETTGTESVAAADVPKSSAVRCYYFPNCTNADCTYFHPSEPCKNFPNCTFGMKCRYIHPQCKFGSKCSRPGCFYVHPIHVTIDCREGFACPNKDTTCKFKHPQ